MGLKSRGWTKSKRYGLEQGVTLGLVPTATQRARILGPDRPHSEEVGDQSCRFPLRGEVTPGEAVVGVGRQLPPEAPTGGFSEPWHGLSPWVS